MNLTFTKGVGKHDRLEITRHDKPIQVIECPKQGIIPHDMVHYAVESTLHMRGFLERVIAGESASFKMEAEATSDSVERLVEVFQGDAWSGSSTPSEDMIEMYRVTCSARNCAMLPVSAREISSVRDRIAELEILWAKVPIGQTLELVLNSSAQAEPRSDA